MVLLVITFVLFEEILDRVIKAKVWVLGENREKRRNKFFPKKKKGGFDLWTLNKLFTYCFHQVISEVYSIDLCKIIA